MESLKNQQRASVILPTAFSSKHPPMAFVKALIVLGIYASHAILDGHGLLTEDQSLTLKQMCPDFKSCSENNDTNGITKHNFGTTCCMPCSCDTSVCVSIGNCCPGTTNSSSPAHAQSSFGKSSNNNTAANRLRCIAPTVGLSGAEKQLSPYRRNTLSKSRLGLYMVSSCPQGVNESRCSEPDRLVLNETTPVFSVESHLNYRNTFCAFCNNESTSDLIKWKAYMTCSVNTVLKADILLSPYTADSIYINVAKANAPNCGIDFIPPENYSHATEDLCFDRMDTINMCLVPYSSSPLQRSCDDFLMPYIVSEENSTYVYANYFCYLCNNGTEDENHCSTDFGLTVYENSDLVAELNLEHTEASSLMPRWLQTDLTPSGYIPSGVRCKGQTTYDPYLERCREWLCPEGRYFVNGMCIPLYSDVIKTTYSLALKMIPDPETFDSFQNSNKTILAENLLYTMFGKDDLFEVEIILLAKREDDSYMYTFVLLHVHENINNASKLFDQATYGNDISIATENGTVTLNVNFSTGLNIELDAYPFSDIVIIDLFHYVPLRNIYRVHIDEIKKSFKYPSISKLAFCSQMLIQRNELRDYIGVFDIIISSVRIYEGEFGRTTRTDQYRICWSDYLKDAQRYLEEKRKALELTPQAIISVICNMLSMAGLLITIFTYIIFDELRSIPGKNNMMLALHLLVAQCLYQFGMDQTDKPKLCIVLGVFIHLFWLTAIFWMNACTLHMFRTFVTGQSYRSVRAFDPQVCIYALYCYSVAISMVGVNIGVSMYQSNGKEVGYGGRLCYISNPVMVGWVFALPVGVIIILNMGFFFAVVYQISASTMRRRGKSTDRANTVIYMKLSSLTGVTWIFGYLYLWTDFTPLEYIFIVLNAGQGVLIFISFICTKRVIKLYWTLIRKNWRTCRSYACACLCDKKLEIETTANEMNTAKISLTAGSMAAKSKQSVKNRQMSRKARPNYVKSSDDVSKSRSSSDLFGDSAKIAHQLCNPVPIGDPVIAKNEPKFNFAKSPEDGAIRNELQNGINNLAIVAVGIHDIEFIPANHK